MSNRSFSAVALIAAISLSSSLYAQGYRAGGGGHAIGGGAGRSVGASVVHSGAHAVGAGSAYRARSTFAFGGSSGYAVRGYGGDGYRRGYGGYYAGRGYSAPGRGYYAGRGYNGYGYGGYAYPYVVYPSNGYYYYGPVDSYYGPPDYADTTPGYTDNAPPQTAAPDNNPPAQDDKNPIPNTTRSNVTQDPAVVTEVQQSLAQQGYYQGRVDGVAGPLTLAAVSAYQKDKGLPVTGAIDPNLVRSLGLD